MDKITKTKKKIENIKYLSKNTLKYCNKINTKITKAHNKITKT